jgi:hypothetical protein
MKIFFSTGVLLLAMFSTTRASARYYEAETGRFLQEDQEFSTNLYPYAYNSPLNYVDPDGTSPIWGGLLQLANGFSNPANAPDYGTPTYSPVVSDQELINIMMLAGPEAFGGARVGRAAVCEEAGTRIAFGHGARHLASTSLSRTAVEAEIQAQVQTVARSGARLGPFWGRVSVDGQIVQYRAYPLPNGVINVGTYYLPPHIP